MRIRQHAARFAAPAFAATLLGIGLAVPAQASELTPQDGQCQITNAELRWGLKESFRSYISGSIANGSWETSDGADYETPEFIWSDGTGTYDPATGAGEISFTGTVFFQGHDGVLDMTIANPTFAFEGEHSAALALDTKSNDMEGNLAVDEQQQWVAEMELAQDVPTADGPAEFTEMASVLTNSGAAAFAGFYEAGAELDPLHLTYELAGCGSAAAGTAPEAEQSAVAEPIDEQLAEAVPLEPTIIEAPSIPWLPLILGGLALFVIGFTSGIFVGGKKPARGRNAHAPHDGDSMMGER